MEEKALFKPGDRVEVALVSRCYSYYSYMAKLLGLTKFVYGQNTKQGEIATVLKVLPHQDFNTHKAYCVGIETADGKQTIMGHAGLRLTQTKPLKVGDIVYSISHGRDKLIELIETSDPVCYRGIFLKKDLAYALKTLLFNPKLLRRINE